MRQHKYNTRCQDCKKPRQFEKIYGSDYQFAMALTQMSTKTGIERLGEKANGALKKEWKQLDNLNVFK